MTRKFTYDYYNVDVPGDCYETLDELASLAINEARERSKLYAVPAQWDAKLIKGEVGDFAITFRVRRVRVKKVA